MRGVVAKKIRQVNRRNWREYLREIKKLSWIVRFRLSWWLLFGNPKKVR